MTFLFSHHLTNRVVTVVTAISDTLIIRGPAYNKQKGAEETVRSNWVLIVTKNFNIVNDFDAKKSARYSRDPVWNWNGF